MQETLEIWDRSLGQQDPLEYFTPIFLPGKSHGRRSLVGWSPWGCTELDMTEVTQQQQQQPRKVYIYMLLHDWALIESILTLKYFNLLVYKFNEKMEKWRYYWTFNQIAYLKRHTFLKNPLVLIIIMNVIELRY